MIFGYTYHVNRSRGCTKTHLSSLMDISMSSKGLSKACVVV